MRFVDVSAPPWLNATPKCMLGASLWAFGRLSILFSLIFRGSLITFRELVSCPPFLFFPPTVLRGYLAQALGRKAWPQDC